MGDCMTFRKSLPLCEHHCPAAACNVCKRKALKPFVPSEDHECTVFAAWLELLKTQGKLEHFSHIPNETPTSPIQAARLKRLGVRRGVPDYLLIVAGRVCFVEMKRADGGRLSVQQNDWLRALRAAGARTAVCAGVTEAKAVVLNWLDGRD